MSAHGVEWERDYRCMLDCRVPFRGIVLLFFIMAQVLLIFAGRAEPNSSIYINPNSDL